MLRKSRHLLRELHDVHKYSMLMYMNTKYQSKTIIYYIIITSGLHVSALSSHPQALKGTDPRLNKCIVHSGIHLDNLRSVLCRA